MPCPAIDLGCASPIDRVVILSGVTGRFAFRPALAGTSGRAIEESLFLSPRPRISAVKLILAYGSVNAKYTFPAVTKMYCLPSTS